MGLIGGIGNLMSGDGWVGTVAADCLLYLFLLLHLQSYVSRRLLPEVNAPKRGHHHRHEATMLQSSAMSSTISPASAYRSISSANRRH